jgi:hypothetical protein
VKVVTPTPLVAEAAGVLADLRTSVVIVGAAAIEVALSGAAVTITPTRDVDAVVDAADAAAVVAQLEGAGMTRSTIAHERPFTWVRDDLKVQLVRSFHPFPSPIAKPLPQNPVFGMASDVTNQVDVAFADAPQRLQLRCANAACLLALKEAAFGRTRQGSDAVVQRDYHDAFLLIDAAGEDVLDEWRFAGREVRERGRRAIVALGAGGEATAAAAAEMVRLGQAANPRRAEAAVRRTAAAALRALNEAQPRPAR